MNLFDGRIRGRCQRCGGVMLQSSPLFDNIQNQHYYCACKVAQRKEEDENRIQQRNWHNNNPPSIGGRGSSGTS